MDSVRPAAHCGAMKRPMSLSVSEFQKIVDAMCVRTSTELLAARARMDALRDEHLPPG